MIPTRWSSGETNDFKRDQVHVISAPPPVRFEYRSWAFRSNKTLIMSYQKVSHSCLAYLELYRANFQRIQGRTGCGEHEIKRCDTTCPKRPRHGKLMRALGQLQLNLVSNHQVPSAAIVLPSRFRLWADSFHLQLSPCFSIAYS